MDYGGVTRKQTTLEWFLNKERRVKDWEFEMV